MITVDSNSAENFFCDFLVNENIKFERKRLDVGDIVLSSKNTDFIIERKTWSDLSASICDGRWSEQQSRMNTLDSGQKTLFGYIIEGPLIDWTQTSKMNPKCLWGAIIKAQVRDGFYVFHSNDKKATANLIIYLQKQLMIDGFDALQNSRVVTGVGHKRKRDNLTTPQSVLIAMLSVIPGISKQKATLIVDKYQTMSCIKNATISDISDLQCGQKKIGKKMAENIKMFIS